MFICICKGITEKQVRDAIDNGATSVKELSEQLGVATECGKCCPAIKQLLEEKL